MLCVGLEPRGERGAHTGPDSTLPPTRPEQTKYTKPPILAALQTTGQRYPLPAAARGAERRCRVPWALNRTGSWGAGWPAGAAETTTSHPKHLPSEDVPHKSERRKSFQQADQTRRRMVRTNAQNQDGKGDDGEV